MSKKLINFINKKTLKTGFIKKFKNVKEHSIKNVDIVVSGIIVKCCI